MKLNNYYRIHSGLYVVRTQAGFKQALKKFSGLEHLEHGEERYEIVGNPPTTYPSLVTFRFEYVGYHYVNVNHTHMNQLRERLNEADPLPVASKAKFDKSVRFNLIMFVFGLSLIVAPWWPQTVMTFLHSPLPHVEAHK